MRFIQATILCFAAAVILLPALAAWAGTGAMTVINESGLSLSIYMDGSKKCTLGPGQSKTLEDIPDGAHEFQARTSSGEVKFSKQLRIVAGRTGKWTLKHSNLIPDPQPGIYLVP